MGSPVARQLESTADGHGGETRGRREQSTMMDRNDAKALSRARAIRIAAAMSLALLWLNAAAATAPEIIDTKATCNCGNVLEIGMTIADLKMDICSNCHPFYTGTHKVMDTEGRLERFKNKYAKATAAKK